MEKFFQAEVITRLFFLSYGREEKLFFFKILKVIAILKKNIMKGFWWKSFLSSIKLDLLNNVMNIEQFIYCQFSKSSNVWGSQVQDHQARRKFCQFKLLPREHQSKLNFCQGTLVWLWTAEQKIHGRNARIFERLSKIWRVDAIFLQKKNSEKNFSFQERSLL